MTPRKIESEWKGKGLFEYRIVSEDSPCEGRYYTGSMRVAFSDDDWETMCGGFTLSRVKYALETIDLDNLGYR